MGAMGAQAADQDPGRLSAGRYRRYRCRIAADTLQRQHGYTVIVDNKTGAGGFIALKAVAQSPPDGYTVGIGIMGQLAVGPVVPGSQIPLDLDKGWCRSAIWSACRWR